MQAPTWGLREKNEKNKLLFGNAYFYSWNFPK